MGVEECVVCAGVEECVVCAGVEECSVRRSRGVVIIIRGSAEADVSGVGSCVQRSIIL